jgi:hypothetical protein
MTSAVAGANLHLRAQERRVHVFQQLQRATELLARAVGVTFE